MRRNISNHFGIDVKKTEYFVGLLLPIEEFRVHVFVSAGFVRCAYMCLCRYGYSSNTKTQIIVVADETETKDNDFKSVSLLFCFVLPSNKLID
jgi:hypothetical protein